MSFLIEEPIGCVSSGFSLDYGNADVRQYVSSREALARELGCSVRTVAAMLNEAGNPGKTQNGSYPLQKWKEFYNARDDGNFSLAEYSSEAKQRLQEAVLRERSARAELAELNAAARRKELIPASDFEKVAYEFAARLRAYHSRECSIELVNEISNKLFLDREQSVKLTEILELFHERFCTKVVQSSETLKNDP